MEPLVRTHGRYVTVELSGELDIGTAADLGAALSAAVAREPTVEIDLSPSRMLSGALPYWVMTWTV